MPKYLFKANYTHDGLQGLMSAGGASRVAAVDALAASVGGTSEGFYFAFGDVDAYVIVDLPDDEAAAAAALTVGASGGATVETVKLLTVDQIDAAIARTVDYRPPGS